MVGASVGTSPMVCAATFAPAMPKSPARRIPVILAVMSLRSPLFTRQHGLRRGQPCDRHPIRRAGDIVEPDLLAESDRGRVAAVLAANAELQSGPGGASALNRYAHELTHPGNVEANERVVLQYPEPLIRSDKARGVI